MVGAGAAADPLLAVETNRSAIINRLADQYRDALFAGGVSKSAFRAALASLRADQLLAASLVGSIEDVTAIVSQPPQSGAALQRYVALSPGVPTSMSALPSAEAYVVRDGDTLGIVKAANLQLSSTTQPVGYFAPATAVSYAASTTQAGAGNRATGARSVIVGGGYNLASGQWSIIGGGGRQTNDPGGAGTFRRSSTPGTRRSAAWSAGSRRWSDACTSASVAGPDVQAGARSPMMMSCRPAR